MGALTTTDRWYVQKMTGIGTDESVFTNDELDDLYTLAEDNREAALLLVLRSLLADAAKLHDYRIAQSAESLSQVYKQLSDLLAYYESKTNASQQVRIVGMRAVPPRTKDEPDV